MSIISLPKVPFTNRPDTNAYWESVAQTFIGQGEGMFKLDLFLWYLICPDPSSSYVTTNLRKTFFYQMSITEIFKREHRIPWQNHLLEVAFYQRQMVIDGKV